MNVKDPLAFILIAAACLALTGCRTPQPTEPTRICPGKTTIRQAVAELAQQRERLMPLQATADCVIAWDNISRREPLDAAQIRFVPPDKLFFRGVRFGEIRFGANEDEFWLRIKPDLDTYWYGSRAQVRNCTYALPMNPSSLAEALGVVEVDTRWELFHRDGYDWLTLREQGRPVKRVYVNCCGYRVERIEYFDRDGRMTAATELSDYTTIAGGAVFPKTMRLTTFYRGQEDSSATIELRHVQRFEPTDRQMRNLFERPGRDGYGTVLWLDAYCNFIEEN